MARVKQFDQNEVLEKAMNLFWNKGFHATSMQDLVDHLGINRASIYATFESKNELFNRSISLYQELETKRIADFLYQYVNVRQGLYYLFETDVQKACSSTTKNGCFLINSIAELANTNHDICAQLSIYQGNFERAFINYLQYGVNQGQISPYKDIYAIANYLFILQGGFKTVSKIQHNSTELTKTITIGLTILD